MIFNKSILSVWWKHPFWGIPELNTCFIGTVSMFLCLQPALVSKPTKLFRPNLHQICILSQNMDTRNCVETLLKLTSILVKNCQHPVFDKKTIVRLKQNICPTYALGSLTVCYCQSFVINMPLTCFI